MKKIRASIRKVFWLYVVMFLCLVISLFLISVNSSQITSSYNPRIRKDDNTVMRGDIKDYNGNILGKTVKKDGGFKREYTFDREFAHVLGYADMGKSAVELKYNFELGKVRFELIERIKQFLYNTDLKGNNLTLTLDQQIQKKAYDLLGNRKGAIMAIEPSTGKILAMVSYPNFNSNTIVEDWENLNSDSENSPLLNRASQGLYPPGSVFKIVTTATMIENIETWQDFKYECLSEETFGDKTIRCYESKKHGNVDLKQAFAVSCNTTFAKIGELLGADKLKSTAERLGFNKDTKYPLEYNKSIFSLSNNSTESELVQTAIGQGKTLVTPFEMARITSAIANGGILMQPYILDHIEDNRGNTIKKYMPQKESQLFSYEVSKQLVDMMVEVVNSGTAKSAKIDNVLVAGKTGTAEVDNKAPHSWFTGFAPADKPQVAVVVIVENSGEGGMIATPIAKELIKEVINK